jgi:hypothetical protein
MGHICVVMRATLDMRPAGRMFDMPALTAVSRSEPPMSLRLVLAFCQ